MNVNLTAVSSSSEVENMLSRKSEGFICYQYATRTWCYSSWLNTLLVVNVKY